MRWILEVAYIGTTTSWRWLLGSTAVAGALVGLLFGIGVIGGGVGDGDSNPRLASVSATPTPDADPGTISESTIPDASPTAIPEPAVIESAKFISVPILATRADNVGSLEFVLTYDPAKVELAQVERGLLSGDALIDSGSPSPGRLWAGIIDINGITGSGPVAVVKFKIKDDADGTMPLSLESIAAYDANTLVDIVTRTTAGAFNIAEAGALSPIVTFQ
ncbi:MAG: cohesin domain-containing protein [Chloroflexota bacterium]|nr:cohesin domain-containing protein [Chloroflexota bacterium]